MDSVNLGAYLWPEDVTGRLPRLGRRFDPTHRLNSNTTYTLYGGELYGPNNQSLAVPPLEAGLTVGLGAGGIGLVNSGASANGLDYSHAGRYLTETGGVFHATTTVTLTGAASICAVWGETHGNQHIFGVGADGDVTFGIYQDYGLACVQAAPAGTVPMGRATTISAYWQAGVGVLIAVDGKLCTSYSNVWVQGSPTNIAWAYQCWGGKLKIFAGASGTLHYLKIQNAVRTAKDLIEISRNPNELFEPLPDLPFSLSAVGSGATTVTSDSTASYKVQGSVQFSSAATYGIRSATQSDSVGSYVIRASTQNDAASAYGIRGVAQQSSMPAYTIRGLISQVAAANYAVRSAASSDASATYSILSAVSVSSSKIVSYNISGGLSQGVATSYSVRGIVVQSVTAAYALRTTASQSTTATYSILSASSVSSSVTTGYTIRSLAQFSIVAGYSIAQSVQREVLAGYSIAQSVQMEALAGYHVRSGVAKEIQVVYSTRGAAQQSVTSNYLVSAVQSVSSPAQLKLRSPYFLMTLDGLLDTYRSIDAYQHLD